MKNWIEAKDRKDNIVLSSRIRIARNLKDYPFPHMLNEEKSREVIKKIEDSFYRTSDMKDNYTTNYLKDKDDVEAYSYFEKHLISNKLLINSKKSAFILNKDETVSIMLNEEDHIRLQCITAGFDLNSAYEEAEKIDNFLEEDLEFAFDEKLGYLSVCPTNVGTGLRASIMLHLPALSMQNEINGVLNVLTQVGMTLRGLYGEGSGAFGNLYQVSNQVTLGVSEEEILTNLSAVINQLINGENGSRELLMKKYKYELEDKVYRSLGLLKNAVLLSSKECLTNLSNVRMGVEMGLIKDIDRSVLNKLLVDSQPASVQKIVGKKLNDKERDIKRAEIVREKLKEVVI